MTKKFVNQIPKYDEIMEKGGNSTRSVLLYGPCGTGKTTFSKAIAKEIHVDETGKNLKMLFDEVCKNAAKNDKKIAIIRFDDINKILSKNF